MRWSLSRAENVLKGGSARRRWWIFAVALLLATMAAYQPAWRGGPVWDDNFHITQPSLRSWDGLVRIWSERGATLQYYPLLHSAFWMLHRFWGDAPLGYHLTTILMHVVGALLFASILCRLHLPGAFLAAAIFALHPVQTESVAWMTELKNTLSGVFYFAAALLYLRFEEDRTAGRYLSALLAFALALLTKTVTGTLPGALLVLAWWRRGRISWRDDVRPLLPWVILGVGFGLMTARWELEFNHATGPDFQFTPVERLLLAGRIVWFLLGKLCWPANLIFIYPRWQIDAGAAWQYLYPAGLVTVALGLWAIRGWSRGPLAALLYFCGTLLPVLGFFNLYTYRYSLVADHYVYLASAGVFALAAAGGVWLLRPTLNSRPFLGPALALALLATLGGLTFRESRAFADAEALYRTTLARDPSCWFAYTNLGALKLDSSPAEAVSYFQEALRLKPDLAEARGNLGTAYQRLGRLSDAVTEYERAVAVNPRLPGAQGGLAMSLLALGRLQESIPHFVDALQMTPGDAELQGGMGAALQGMGRASEAAAHYTEALRLKPDDGDVRCGFGNVLLDLGRLDEAVTQYRQALTTAADKPAVYNGLGVALDRMGRADEALPAFREALALKPDYQTARFNLANVLQAMGRTEQAVAEFEQVLARSPDDAEAHNNLGVALTTFGRLREAQVHFREAIRIKPDYADARANLERVTAALRGGR